MQTSLPEEVADRMKALLFDYNVVPKKTLDDILDFYVRFERIHPFKTATAAWTAYHVQGMSQIQHRSVYHRRSLKLFYYRGLKEWYNERDISRIPA